MTAKQVSIYDVMAADKEKQINHIVAQAKRRKPRSQADKVIEFLNVESYPSRQNLIFIANQNMTVFDCHI